MKHVAELAAKMVEEAHKGKKAKALAKKDPQEAKEDPKEEAGESYSEEAQEAIGEKMHKMKSENRPQKQKVAIAMSEARQKGLKVPSAKK